jgi:hypothetical protein
MKKMYCSLILAILAAACQQQAPPVNQAVAKAAAPSLPSIALPASSLPSLFAATDTLTAASRILLQRYDFGRLWEGQGPRHEYPVLEGIFGSDHYRFELVISQALRDPQRPEYYQVSGKCHYRKNVRPFTGWLIVRELDFLTPPFEEDDGTIAPGIRPDSVSPSKVDYYRLRAEFQLAEQPTANSGELRGEAVLNFYVAPPGRLGYVQAPMRETDGLWREGALLMRGTRRNITTKQLKKFVVADNVFVAAADVYQDFGIGDRGNETDINPKYAHLGWKEKWENDEWWTDSPKLSLNL